VAGVVPVLVGTAASETLHPLRFLGALTVALALQVAVNFANDYFDAVKGVDDDSRIGPRRATAGGLISPARMKVAITASFFVAGVAGGLLALAVGPGLFAIGLVCLLAALGYSGGPRPYGAAAMGEVFVFIFFGLVATVGSAYIQTETISWVALAASVPVGLLASAILAANNLRDMASDARTGKKTLSVQLGASGAIRLYRALVAGAFISLPIVVLSGGGWQSLAPILTLPLALGPLEAVRRRTGAELIEVLVSTAKLELVFGVFLAAGLAFR